MKHWALENRYSYIRWQAMKNAKPAALKRWQKTRGGKETKGKQLNYLHQAKCLNSWQSDFKRGPWAFMSCTDRLSVSRLALTPTAAWRSAYHRLRDVELYATAPPSEHGQLWIWLLTLCRRQKYQLVLRLLNAAVHICSPREVDCLLFLLLI